jgi:hypothetical protein
VTLIPSGRSAYTSILKMEVTCFFETLVTSIRLLGITSSETVLTYSSKSPLQERQISQGEFQID